MYQVTKIMDLLGENRTSLVIEYLRQMFIEKAMFGNEKPVKSTSSIVSGTDEYDLPSNMAALKAVYLLDADSEYRPIARIIGEVGESTTSEVE